MYVIKKSNSNLYVGQPGRKNAYTNKLELARKFNAKEEAKKACCGNEYVIAVSDLL